MGRVLSGLVLPLLLLTGSLTLLIVLFSEFSESIFDLFEHAYVSELCFTDVGCFGRNQSWRSPSVIYFLVIQLSAALVALTELYGRKIVPDSSRGLSLRQLDSSFEQIVGSGMYSIIQIEWENIYFFCIEGSHLRVVCCLLLPAIQLVVGISHPSWVSLPFFLCSCIGLVDWSLTSNFLGLFWWWRYLLFYGGLNIILLYVYQLPIEFSTKFQWFARFIGLFKFSAKSQWSETCSGLSLLLFYVMLSCIRCDLMEMNIILCTKENSLIENLLPSKHSFFIHESSSVKHEILANFKIHWSPPTSETEESLEEMLISEVIAPLPIADMQRCEEEKVADLREGRKRRLMTTRKEPAPTMRKQRSGMKHSNVLLRGEVFRTFSINFFTYGFPISLLALSFWSFQFASLCAFGLLAYVGYLLYAFPSLLHLHRLNVLLLVFILLWAISTYVFNVAFTILNKKLLQDMAMWETVGLWHYPIPGYFLLAQFCLGVLVALSNLVNSSVLSYLSDSVHLSTKGHPAVEDEVKEVLIIATIAWGLRKSSRAIVLVLILLIALKPGFIHAVYMVFFMIYLLSNSVSRTMRKSLILLCEAHFAVLYILQLSLISKALEQKGWWGLEILSQLGLLDHASSWDFIKIAGLVCFCSIHSHGFDMLLSFSAIVQQTPFPPIGWNIMRAGLNESVLSSVYTSFSRESAGCDSSHESRITLYLRTIGQKFLSAYRSCGTYIVCLTILSTVYLVTPNYATFGYLFFLLLWINGRQILGKTRTRLWFPLKVYSVGMFILIYSLSVFLSFETWLSGKMDLYPAFGYNPDASMLRNVWESLSIVIVMELYSYERKLSKSLKFLAYEEPVVENFAFIKRILIWHSEKILFLALLYASLSPISAFGFVYLLGLVICSTLPKSSHIPGKIFLIYSGFLLMIDYLFQMWGELAEMFPHQKYSYISFFLGLQLFKPGFFGLESGMRGKVLVIVACVLQYNVFHWLENIPCDSTNKGKWDEPCALFQSTEERASVVSVFAKERQPSKDSIPLLEKRQRATSNFSPSFGTGISQVSNPVSLDGRNTRSYSFKYTRGSSKENHKWQRKSISFLRKERLDMQKTSMKIYIRYCVENMFNLFGLEINMVALLLASFAVLNAISLLYIASLAACVLIPRHVIRRFWPIFVFVFASVLTLEYLTIWLNVTSWEQEPPIEAKVACCDCWRDSDIFFDYCKKCWLGFIVDDPRMLVSYYMVFMLACFKLRADHLSSLSELQTYLQMKKASVWSDLSFETKSMWTFIDYLRLYSYCHLLDLVLALMLITGTLEYDILHIGYLGFALLFFRMRLQILKKKNRIFKFLRMYNFALIVFSLAYQSPFVGDSSSSEGKCEAIDYMYEVIGFYKYDYGFRITSRSALVEIIIFMLVSLQSYMFSTQEFDYVSKYLEAEQVDALVREQEKRAAWKTAQLQHIRKSEEQKRLRNLQVENMKTEMLNLKIQLHRMSMKANCGNTSPGSEGCRMRKNSVLNSSEGSGAADKDQNDFRKHDLNFSDDSLFPFELSSSPTSVRTRSPSGLEAMGKSLDLLQEFTELKERPFKSELLDSDRGDDGKYQAKKNPLTSAAHLIGDGVSHMKSLGNMAVAKLVNFFDIEYEEPDSNECFSDNEVYYELENQNTGSEPLEQTFSLQSGSERNLPDSTCLQIGIILRYMWAQMRSNNDIVCYCCFVLIFLWNFSLLSMVYLAALFLYALCVNTGPSYLFWVVMLIYSEACILLQYLYQIIIQHSGFSIHVDFLQELGFPENRITSSFVMSNLPLFLVYIFTLLQTSITARDGEWASLTEFSSLKRKNLYQKESLEFLTYWDRIQKLLLLVKDATKVTVRSLIRYWKSVTQGAETPPYFVQISMEVNAWPDDGIQPERIESGINKLLKVVHDVRCKEKNPTSLCLESRVRVQSIERSPENPTIALAVFEVVYASPSMESVPLEWYKSLTPAADVANEILIAQRVGILEEIGFPYFIQCVIGGGRREIDLYAYVFCADLAVFFLVAIFYQSVIKNNSEFLEVYQLEDQFPKEFVFILMVIFFLIVLDRIIYLCSFATGKVIFYLFTLVLYTYSVTKYAWYTKPSNQHAGRLALRAIYLMKAISFALQAIQIRYGIPHESTLYRQFLTSSVSQINFLGFRLYRALPFLYELRCVLDWSCTTTSLTMYDWLKLEDIHASLFLVKCDVNLNRVTHQQGQKQTKRTKFCNGICLFLVLLCVIWAPMLMYSSGNPTNIANPIKDARVQMDLKTIGGSLTLFETTLCKKLSWDELDGHVDLDPQGYLSAYTVKDIQLICCQADASTLWLVPPTVQARLGQSLTWSMNFVFSWQFTRDRPKGKEVVKYELHVQDQDLPTAVEVMNVLNGTTNSFRINNVYPRYFRVTGSGDVRFLEQAVNLVSGDIVLNRGNGEWWSFHDVDASDVSGCGGLAGPMAIIISEETPQGILGETLNKFSIWGLYITFVLAVGRFIRLQCSDLRMRIPYENLPSCDRLLAICEDIYAARAEGELEVEEVLYWTLVKIYRSPHMLLEYTKLD
ncbi:hypothetical protein RJ640_002214 [Escallonia rubra]|uniref:Piezo non-specific cation channel R-Ras-binding domain-containing protein n=1 Tax=Escallonia rubra TaxID=112253 RepID=A0AA88UAE3_9ASTE|nr:hypothetical protein RJ640_002214 [Escallonia rubra]